MHKLSAHAQDWPRMIVRVGKGRQQHMSKLQNNADVRCAWGMYSIELLD